MKSCVYSTVSLGRSGIGQIRIIVSCVGTIWVLRFAKMTQVLSHLGTEKVWEIIFSDWVKLTAAQSGFSVS
ncbi:hypothetical protein L873DRAFT_14763 [Choiromyces venosus 120613-1]|uniref:Uncharacterized protein n=1 Tax=Choiromyces venosus 120613-1 TaxID=1336337 RepID=A0A3N4KJM7_9PEZI|nr:hypothetical protein L873DRAFT_14763 [Choiromyces venosus 120613-1]